VNIDPFNEAGRFTDMTRKEEGQRIVLYILHSWILGGVIKAGSNFGGFIFNILAAVKIAQEGTVMYATITK
jgi:hypothetical protein